MPELPRRTLLAGAAIAGAASTLRAPTDAAAVPGGQPPAPVPAADAGVSVDEAGFVSTNATARYGLAAIQRLALVGDHLP